MKKIYLLALFCFAFYSCNLINNNPNDNGDFSQYFKSYQTLEEQNLEIHALQENGVNSTDSAFYSQLITLKNEVN